MFRGVTTVKLDAKGRMSIPTRYRERLQEQGAGQLVVTVDRDHCLLLYPLPEWEEIEAKLVKLPSFNPQARRLQRLLVGHATELDMDSHGRVLLPQPLREFAGIDRAAVVIGQGNKFEIWDEAAWNERRDSWLEDGEEDAPLPAELESLSL